MQSAGHWHLGAEPAANAEELEPEEPPASRKSREAYGRIESLIAEHPACSERRCRGAGGPSCGLPGSKLASHRIVCTQHLLQYSAILQHKRSSKQTGARGSTSRAHPRTHTCIRSHQRLQAPILALTLGVAPPPNAPDKPEPADAPGQALIQRQQTRARGRKSQASERRCARARGGASTHSRKSDIQTLVVGRRTSAEQARASRSAL